jgi:hypothetical protein
MSHLDPTLNTDTTPLIPASALAGDGAAGTVFLVLVGNDWKRITFAQLLAAVVAHTDTLYDPIS